ncbi:MAG TPA: cytidylate kinase-like family protein [Ktedonobacterales bacterium]|nr:cytidylate kinase-like family protein [Ktedonobacterales bacterium]
MADERERIALMRIVTMSREYGSGGGEVAARLAARLDWTLIDHEIVAQVARRLGVPEDEAEQYDERGEGLLMRLLAGMRSYEPTIPVPPPMAISDEQRYRDALRQTVEAACDEGHVVIVGRGAQVLLRDRRDVLHVRLVAPLEARIVYVMRREGLERGPAQARIQMKDRDRMRYMQAAHRVTPTDALLYDLTINTAVLDLEAAVELIALALGRKAQRLAAPVGELGPAVGMPPYPGQPADLRPPESASETESTPR